MREQRTLEIFASVSRRDRAEDRKDDKLWRELSRRVKDVVEDPRYDPIASMITYVDEV